MAKNPKKFYFLDGIGQIDVVDMFPSIKAAVADAESDNAVNDIAEGFVDLYEVTKIGTVRVDSKLVIDLAKKKRKK